MPQLWWIGDTDHDEFAEAWGTLQGDDWAARVFAEPGEALTVLAEDSPPELFLFACRFPGDLSATAVAQLQAAAPLTRSIVLLGSLCEGELRTGVPWPGVVRYYWHQWRWRLAPALRRWRELADMPAEDRQASFHFPWELPLTASEDERCLALLPPAVATPGKAPLIGVVGHDAAGVETLAAVIRAAGFHAVALPPSAWRGEPRSSCKYPGLAACIWDGCGPLDRQRAELAAVVECFSPLPVVAAVSFPRHDPLERAHRAGVSAVISKPYQRADVAAAVAYALGAAAEKGAGRELADQPISGAALSPPQAGFPPLRE